MASSNAQVCNDRQLERTFRSTDLATVYEKLIKVSTRWFELGLALRVDHDMLERIRCNHSGRCEVCLRTMLACSLKSEHPPTWLDICNGLRNPTVHRYDVAREIEDLCQSEDADHEVDTPAGTPPPEQMTTIISNSRKRQLDSQMTVEQLNNSLMSICKQYRKLSVDIRESLTKRGILPGELIALLQDFHRSFTDRKGESLLDAIGHLINRESLPKAKSIAEIFDEIAPSLTFLDYDILKHITDAYGSDMDGKHLIEYEENLEKFLKSWKVPHSNVKIPRTESSFRDDQVQMCFKLKTLKHNMPYYPELKKITFLMWLNVR